ncbi:uncharacterized protein LOC116014824 [Ipomoea triloba]|uniref:uncharacterized protein LOC116014824 n=1 Tax=Ipomoea triloba TaxID=35885 RepID=UPI00125DF868|nr:uncharacterized protein LOC116014824 [Ipomoea triloba]
MSIKVLILMAMQGLMLVMMQVEGQFAENGNLYTCWGGCYNQCVLLGRSSAVAGGGNFPCYIGCLSSCVPQSAAQYQNYCQIGCSLQLCFPSITNGAQLENCFANCANVCGL